MTHHATYRKLGYLCVALLAIPYLIHVLSFWHMVPFASGQSFGSEDPDPWLRLTLVRDWLSGGSWYDHTMHRSNAPWGGIASPWTRPLDLLLAALVHLQPETTSLDSALLRSALLVPWLAMTVFLLGLVRIARLLAPTPHPIFLAVGLIATCPMFWMYFRTATADHHSILAACFIWLMRYTLDTHYRPAHAMYAGLIGALMLWISVEALIPMGMIYGWFGLQWLLAARADAWRFHCLMATTTAIGACIAIGIERPATMWFTPIYDSISVVQASLMLCCAAASWMLAQCNPRQLTMRLLLAAGAAVAIAACMHFSYPLFFRGPMAEVDPYILTDFLPRVHEAQPIYRLSAGKQVSLLFQPIVALALCFLAIYRTHAPQQRLQSLQLGFFAFASLALLFHQIRWYYYAYPMTVLALLPWLGALFSPQHAAFRESYPALWMTRLSLHHRSLVRPLLIAALLIFPTMILSLLPSAPSTLNTRRDACHSAALKLIAEGEITRRLGTAPLIIFADANLGAHLLFFTPHRIVASNYHREGAGMRYLNDAHQEMTEDALRQYLAIRNIDALILCPQTDKKNMLDAWQQGAALPAWLKNVPYTMPTQEKTDTPAPIGSAPMLLQLLPAHPQRMQ